MMPYFMTPVEITLFTLSYIINIYICVCVFYKAGFCNYVKPLYKEYLAQGFGLLKLFFVQLSYTS